ncbi:branched-chain amino acid ABC transporter permease [Bradyrhizobium sp. U87765 SZCCT0131]|uniref:branched-chain amino acid ABC transporter permease n=1 Tax=unclassified Bradyrhizobium TaxID=2631580 RepID=UPI001BACA1D3|nr:MULTISPECIES: branched-chain amino acid ABC transporter permease [unclassified Bradyrhizobium]MBR1217706.1 branched-chain amino acid ABC transporter permease [Bradyrhizobium sp. U87765 SZCCT0131]MBR1261348.1 branched-chain amino acid ABC transporter permease [Bradyrhizobium sp. U87765 SZCCT0134]MBR1303204.1 branched-chain amino acid ABC transporter permease [Bradyrhizobium sp. U87765 SZCCT0110]MBR1318810.1 branched-chain amino acid ABC transporter permease [Bradyrhizobium sp. U87765 SZCCT010
MNALLTSAVAGLTAGGAYALLGVCSVFTYRLVAVINFTAAAIGAAGTFVLIALSEAGMPLWPAVFLGLLAGVLIGVTIGFVMTRWFAEATASSKAAVTVALLVGMVAFGLRVTGGQHPHHFPDLFPGSAFRLAGVEVTKASALTIALAILFTVASDLFLNRTRTGLHLRALSERPMAAELIGVPVQRLALLVWGITGAVTTFSLMLIAPQRSPDFMSLSLLVVPALAAALIGLFRSFWMTLIGGITIGMIEGMTSVFGSLNQYRGAVPFLIILAVLLWLQRGARWDEAR